MFKVNMLHADHGDCIWVEYGDAKAPKRILIDAGTPGTYERSLLPRVEAIVAAEGRCVIELFVITHVDDDHIGGSLEFLDKLDKRKVKIKQIWFNGFFHLSNQTPKVLGPGQGEKLTALIERGGWPWNKSFGGRAVMVPEEGQLPSRSFSGMKLTLLSPTFPKLQKLLPVWKKVIRAAGLVPGRAVSRSSPVLRGGFLGAKVETLARTAFKQDRAEANGSSIAFLAEFEGTSVIFGADAHPSVLVESARRKPLGGVPREVDAFKLPHHGSRNNVSTEMLQAFPAINYLISSDGAKFQHPDEEAIARVVVLKSKKVKKLHFNVVSEFNKMWDEKKRRSDFRYSAKFGKQTSGLVVDL